MSRLQSQIYIAMLAGLTVLFAILMPRVYIGPFSATLGLHVPLFLSFLFGPLSALLVGLISTFGFILAGLPLVIAARAAMHGLVGLLGGWLIVRLQWGFIPALIAVAPLHAITEALIVLPFGFSLEQGLWLVGVGTLAHHALDGTIAVIVQRILSRAGIFKK